MNRWKSQEISEWWRRNRLFFFKSRSFFVYRSCGHWLVIYYKAMHTLDLAACGNNMIISRLSMIVRVNVVLNRTDVDSHWRFDNLCGSHLQNRRPLSRDYTNPDDHSQPTREMTHGFKHNLPDNLLFNSSFFDLQAISDDWLLFILSFVIWRIMYQLPFLMFERLHMIGGL